ncbi:MAG: hypothetical protein KKB50_03185 [Planctomycetes bacterium]|nr:hypothetical protein [Planctomycetota bacterium]
MSRPCQRWHRQIGLAVLLGITAALAGADQPSTTPNAAALAQLETRISSQGARLEALRGQVAALQQADADGDRAEAMKQQIRQVLGDAEFRDSLVPAGLQSGYKRGFYIRGSDERFLLRINARMQFRWTHYEVGTKNRYLAPRLDRNDRTGFDVTRLYLTFSGHAYDPDLTYAVILDGSEYRRYEFGILHAWVNYRFADGFQVRAGVMRVSGTRANVDTSTMQFVETPIVEEAYTLHRGLGIRFWGTLFAGQPVQGRYRLDILNSLATPATQTITPDDTLLTEGHDNNPAIVFRTVWSLLDTDCQHPEEELPYSSASCDMAFHTQPALSAGFHYAYTEDDHDGTLRIPVAYRGPVPRGGFLLVPSDGLQIHQFGVDAGFKYRGFSATGEYVMRVLDVRRAAKRPYSPVYLFTGDGDTSDQHAAYVQCGYFLPIPGFERKIEVVGRVGWLHISTGGAETTWEYSGGLNYYIEGQRVKLQTDVTRITEAPFAFSANSLANPNDAALIWRMQLQLAF